MTLDPSPMTPDELRDILARLGISQSELATQIGVDPSTVWRWVHGTTSIPSPIAALMRLVIDPK